MQRVVGVGQRLVGIGLLGLLVAGGCGTSGSRGAGGAGGSGSNDPACTALCKACKATLTATVQDCADACDAYLSAAQSYGCSSVLSAQLKCRTANKCRADGCTNEIAATNACVATYCGKHQDVCGTCSQSGGPCDAAKKTFPCCSGATCPANGPARGACP